MKKRILPLILVGLIAGCSSFRINEVYPGKVYRSHQPPRSQLEELSSLKLKSIVYIHERKPEEYETEYAERNQINFRHIGIAGYSPDVKKFKEIINYATKEENQPVLIHCRGGRHRTGMIAGVLEKIAGKDMKKIIKEYRGYSGFFFWQWPRKENEEFIREFEIK